MSTKDTTRPSKREAADQQVTDFLHSTTGSMIMAGIVILLVISFIYSAVN